MSANFHLTDGQLDFWQRESHGVIGKPAIALIYPDGEVLLDYHDEVLLAFEESRKNPLYDCPTCGEHGIQIKDLFYGCGNCKKIYEVKL